MAIHFVKVTQKAFIYTFIFLNYDHHLSNCPAVPISATQCWPTLHKRAARGEKRAADNPQNMTKPSKKTCTETHLFMNAASWEHRGNTYKIYSPTLPPSFHLTGGESLWPHGTEKWGDGGRHWGENQTNHQQHHTVNMLVAQTNKDIYKV